MEILYARMVYNGFKWVGPETRKALALKVGMIDIYLCMVNVLWLCEYG